MCYFLADKQRLKLLNRKEKKIMKKKTLGDLFKLMRRNFNNGNNENCFSCLISI